MRQIWQKWTWQFTNHANNFREWIFPLALCIVVSLVERPQWLVLEYIEAIYIPRLTSHPTNPVWGCEQVAWFNSEARKQIVSETEHKFRKCAVLFARICWHVKNVICSMQQINIESMRQLRIDAYTVRIYAYTVKHWTWQFTITPIISANGFSHSLCASVARSLIYRGHF